MRAPCGNMYACLLPARLCSCADRGASKIASVASLPVAAWRRGVGGCIAPMGVVPYPKPVCQACLVLQHVMHVGKAHTRGAVVASHRAAVAVRRFQLLVSAQSLDRLRPNPPWATRTALSRPHSRSRRTGRSSAPPRLDLNDQPI
jgi:hypothetical protein